MPNHQNHEIAQNELAGKLKKELKVLAKLWFEEKV